MRLVHQRRLLRELRVRHDHCESASAGHAMQMRQQPRTDSLADGGKKHVHAGGYVLVCERQRKRATGDVQQSGALMLLVVVGPARAHT